jgi:hypothetical protein
MPWSELVGYVASALVVLTFYMKDMTSLRVVAMFSNIAFLAYGASLGLGPVIFLHSMLLPLNLWRLAQIERPTVRDAAAHVRAMVTRRLPTNRKHRPIG